MFKNLIPYTDIHEMNLDWIIAKVKEYIIKYDLLEQFVSTSIEEQQKIIDDAISEQNIKIQLIDEKVDNGLQEIKDYIDANLRIIANEIINELIESGDLYVGTTYDAQTEELNIVLSREE